MQIWSLLSLRTNNISCTKPYIHYYRLFYELETARRQLIYLWIYFDIRAQQSLDFIIITIGFVRNGIYIYRFLEHNISI